MIELLNVVAPLAIAIFVVGVGLRLGRFAWALVTKRHFRGVSPTFESSPPRMGVIPALYAVLFGPFNHFYKRANPVWGRGYLLYHVAIITEVIGYTISALIVFANIVVGRPVPDVSLHLAESFNYSPANLLAIIFGNGEHLQAHFLFGEFGSLFIGITWIAVGFAVVGNLHLMVALVRKWSGAVVSELIGRRRVFVLLVVTPGIGSLCAPLFSALSGQSCLPVYTSCPVLSICMPSLG